MAGVLSHEEAMALIRQAQAGDAQALERMVGANLALVRSVCGRFAGRGCEMEELYQLGALGLVKAIRNFRVELNVRFSTYAVPMIMGEIRRFLRDDGPLSVSRRLKETAARAARVAEALRQALLREPTLPEIAQALRCDEHELVMALESASAVASLDAPLPGADGGTLRDVVGEEQADAIDRMALREEIERLPERDRKLIMLRYFRDWTQAQTARALGMTQVQVSRQEARILRRIREAMAPDAKEA